MKTYFVIVSLLVILLMIVSFKNHPDPEPKIPYPEGYRKWDHVKTYIVGPQNPVFKFIGGFNHVYANEQAMKGYASGNFANGSIIVSDVIEAREDSMDIREGKRHHIDVMVKDSIKFAEIGGWGFEQFAVDSKTQRLLTPEIRILCTNCHSKQKDFVFSEYRE